MNNLSLYEYFLPKKNLALEPTSVRDRSKLFVYQTKTDKVVIDRFLNLDQYLPINSFLIFNKTKVIPAKIEMKKGSGGKVIVMFLINEAINELIEDLQNHQSEKSSRVFKIVVDRKVKLGEKLYFPNNQWVEVIKQKKNFFWVKGEMSFDKLLFLLQNYGRMPIPLYLRKTPLSESKLKERYQTIFAEKEGSVAVPTASLHFTNRLLEKLEKKGTKKYFITLHIGWGTFSPITQENLKTRKLHQEFYQIKKDIWQEINQEKSDGKKLVAVGTTVVRALETQAGQPPLEFGSSFLKTDLFIFPPFRFRMIDGLITNFHLPRSSLMMLVEAFLQHKKAKRHLVDLYQLAIKNNFRFYSFGDAMLIL